MNIKKLFSLFLIIIFCSTGSLLHAQQQGFNSGLDRQIQGLIHIAEVGTVVDTVNVWGDVGQTGRFVIPRDLNLPELISYAGGVGGSRSNRRELDWVKQRIQIQINRYSPGTDNVEITKFESDYEEPLPRELFKYDLQNEDIVTVQVQQKPNFWDYLGRASPIIGIVTSAIVLYDRF